MSIPIQSVSQPVEISTDNSTWKVLICLASSTLDLTTATTNTDTQCGRFTGYGFPGFTLTANTIAVYDKSSTQVNQLDVLTWAVNGTTLYIRIQSPANGGSYPLGAAYFLKGTGAITATSLAINVNDPVKFSLTFTGQGTISLS